MIKKRRGDNRIGESRGKEDRRIGESIGECRAYSEDRKIDRGGRHGTEQHTQ
jgi:hypothetical protein